MNTEDMLKSLKSYLQEYGDYNFHFHQAFIQELVLLVKKISFQQVFFNQLITAFNNLREYKHNIYKVDSHERLTGSPFYSIHLHCRNYNLRFLLSFNKNAEPIFLVAFYERSGKRKTGYASYLPDAQNRLDQFEKEICL